MTKTILVTGGAGYIGSHACKALASAGYRPIAYDNLASGHREAVRWGPFVEADLADADRLSSTIRRYDVTAIMHFAALASVRQSMLTPEAFFHSNVVNSLTLLDVMHATGLRQIVFSSSAAVYGIPETVPTPEDAPLRPINPYGQSKLMVEQMLHWYGMAHGVTYTALRYFNAAGADVGGEIGEDHQPEEHLIPLVLEVALGRRSHIDLYGTDYPTPDGTPVRDFIHVQDLAAAHVNALEYLLNGGSSLALNLGAARGWSVREVIAATERIVGRVIAKRDTPRRVGDPAVLVADVTMANRVLQWKPHHSDLDTVIKTAWAWHCRSLPATQSRF
jgi:UDP-glucose-4-epimerase GalE